MPQKQDPNLRARLRGIIPRARFVGEKSHVAAAADASQRKDVYVAEPRRRRDSVKFREDKEKVVPRGGFDASGMIQVFMWCQTSTGEQR